MPRYLSYLPLPRIFERMMHECLLAVGGAIAFGQVSLHLAFAWPGPGMQDARAAIATSAEVLV